MIYGVLLVLLLALQTTVVNADVVLHVTGMMKTRGGIT